MRTVCLTLALIVVASRGHGAVVVSCGFEPAGDTWSYTAARGAPNADVGGADSPANQRILSGSGSWLVEGATTSTLEFSEVLLSGWRDVKVRYHVSSTASTADGGHGPGDKVAAFVALTEYANQNPLAFGATADIALTGRGKARWGYDSGAPQVIKNAGWGGTVHPAGGGLRTSDGYTDFIITVPGGKRSLALKLSACNDGGGEYWNLDDVAIEAEPTCSNDRWWNGGGSGSWSNAAGNANWASAGSGDDHLAWNSANGDNAHFTQAGGTVSIAAATTVAARSLTFAADGYVVAGTDTYSSKIALTDGGTGGPGGNTIEVTGAGHSATINAGIVGNPGVGLTKTGAGTLVLGGANAYTGPTTVYGGTLTLGQHCSILSSVIDVQRGATLDLSSVGLHSFGSDTLLKGSGTIVGNLALAGTHAPGNSVGMETIDGDYAISGLLQIAVEGPAPGDPASGYDQVVIAGSDPHNVSLGGLLDLTWSGSDWSSDGDQLWIVRNDTGGSMTGAFDNYQNGAPIGEHDGRPWHIYYGADADTGRLTGGNDLLLTTAVPIPEPSSLILLLTLSVAGWQMRTHKRSRSV